SPATQSITVYSAARVILGQRFDATPANARAANGERSHTAKRSISRFKRYSPTCSIKPNEPTALDTTATRATPRNKSSRLCIFLTDCVHWFRYDGQFASGL